MVGAGFLDFLRSADPRVFQERELGLDVYFSGASAIVPLVLGVAAATAFVLALFQAVPERRHSIPLLLALGVIAFGVGLTGSYLHYRGFREEGAPPARVLVEGRGGHPESKPGQREALLLLPLFLGGGVLVCSSAGALFLALFGGSGTGGPARTRPGER